MIVNRFRKTRSKAWNNFIYVSNIESRCKICDKLIKTPKGSTTGMLRHLEALHSIHLSQTPTIVTPPIFKLPSPSIQKRIDSLIVTMVIKDCEPYSISKHEGFRELISDICPGYIIPSNNTIKIKINEKYEEQRQLIKKCIDGIRYFSYTADLWRSVSHDYYTAVVLHFIDNDWCLKRLVLACVS